jgi:hypothetical protein
MRSRFCAWLSSIRSLSPRGADQAERPQEVVLAEVLAGGGELALVVGALLGVQTPPGRVELEERVLHEMPAAHFTKYSCRVRVALVSPYSWTYPGGVSRHVEALAEELIAQGHHVRVLTPVDRDSRLVTALHGGARPAPRPLPDYVIALGGTIGLPANGATSNLALAPSVLARLRHELRTGGYDVVHVHSPDAPAIGWDAISARPGPVSRRSTRTRRAHRPASARTSPAPSALQPHHERIAVSEAAAWTGRRWWGGTYRIVPNGVHLPRGPRRRPTTTASSRCSSSGRPSSARACRCCCAPSRRCATTSPPA